MRRIAGTLRSARSDGFTVLAFPRNQFGNQKPNECPEIMAVVEAEYRSTFPMLSKVRDDFPRVQLRCLCHAGQQRWTSHERRLQFLEASSAVR